MLPLPLLSSSFPHHAVPPMGLIKEYVDRAVQTDTDTIPSPYSDPAVVLAAPPLTRRGPHPTRRSSPAGSDSNTYAIPPSPNSPILPPLVSRRPSKRKHPRFPAGDFVTRRIASMPENQSEILHSSHGKRIVSMPDRVRPALEPSAELFQSPTATGDSFGSYSGRQERVRVFRAPSDVPHTPSPPSSPESLLIIAAGAQLPDGFLRRKYSPEPLMEEDEDWITWANSPPRPIPALHGPLSLPYARCPSGAEGTIIEEPDNVAQMIWGLGPDDQPHNQVRFDGLPSHHDNVQNPSFHGPNQVQPRSQKKRTSTPQHVTKSSRTQSSYAKQSLARLQRQPHDDKRNSLNQVSTDIEGHQEIVTGLPWNEGQSIQTDVGIPDTFTDDTVLSPVDNNSILDWQLARIRQALRTSLADMDPYSAYPGGLEPVIPAAVAPGLPQSYPRIFVEPRASESVSSGTRQSPIEVAQQYRQQQLYRQALQKRKLQMQNILPTPPDSSSPQWSSRFSPYLTYCSTFSPESAGSTEHPLYPQKYRSGTSTSQNLRHAYDLHDHNLDTSMNISSAKAPQVVPNVNSTSSIRQSSSSSGTLAKYIKQLQALSPIAHFSPRLASAGEGTGSFRSVHHSPVVPTPPSPESPPALSRGSSYHGVRSIASTRPVQRRLSSVPEEDSTLLELSTSVSPSRLQSHITTSGVSSNNDARTGQISYVGATLDRAIPDLPGLESIIGAPSVACHETPPAKVRLPITKEHNIREQTIGYHGQNKEGQHKKKHRYKKLKGPATNEQATTRGLVG